MWQVKRDEYVNEAKETSQTAMDKASGTAQAAQSYASDLRGQATNLLQQVPSHIFTLYIHTQMQIYVYECGPLLD